MEEKSCGVIPFKIEKGKIKFLLIRHHAGHWGFPKGHQNPGESNIETAERELKEETGLEIEKIYKKAYLERYAYKRDNNLKRKQVYYFIGQVKSGEVRIQPEEIMDYAWATFDQAVELINFAEMRKILEKAQNFLTKKPILQKGE